MPNLKSQAPYRDAAPKPVEGDTVPTNLGYFRCITAADDNLGRLLKELDDLKLADDTVVIFASDNGHYLGEHGLGDKRSAYDESQRIPLIVRYPRLAAKGKTVDKIALNVDLAPTLLDLAVSDRRVMPSPAPGGLVDSIGGARAPGGVRALSADAGNRPTPTQRTAKPAGMARYPRDRLPPGAGCAPTTTACRFTVCSRPIRGGRSRSGRRTR